MQRGVGLVATGAADKPRATAITGGKVTLEDLEGPGSINGVPALEFNIDTIEDKPWNKPGADISGKDSFDENMYSSLTMCTGFNIICGGCKGTATTAGKAAGLV